MTEEFLKILKQQSQLHRDGTREVFEEGPMSDAAKQRSIAIKKALTEGFLEKVIEECRSNPETLDFKKLELDHQHNLDVLVDSVTSEVGRALVGLTILQLTIKCIQPEQSIRLHKGSATNGQRDFSWKEGVSMRSLDKTYITPVLRKYDLLRLNADGFMMTRSLAENYPYTTLYKANLRGARTNWLTIVELVEKGSLNPLLALKYLLSRLLNSASNFKVLAAETIVALNKYIVNNKDHITQESVMKLLTKHTELSDYSARLMEISMHCLLQAFESLSLLGEAELTPLSQMRSANKKHGNIGDIELKLNGDISESWDAKYGKTYLRDELEELNDKLNSHVKVSIAGFVTSADPDRGREIIKRCEEISDLTGTQVMIMSYKEWVDYCFGKLQQSDMDPSSVAQEWLIAYTESIAQLRREKAPIDEPCEEWLKTLKPLFG